MKPTPEEIDAIARVRRQDLLFFCAVLLALSAIGMVILFLLRAGVL